MNLSVEQIRKVIADELIRQASHNSGSLWLDFDGDGFRLDGEFNLRAIAEAVYRASLGLEAAGKDMVFTNNIAYANDDEGGA